ncbi:hypothetical protein GZH53_08255 [Flavihumibacter sp. R14]|nr:hypothetical protein [Flavihumibacter soli]
MPLKFLPQLSVYLLAGISFFIFAACNKSQSKNLNAKVFVKEINGRFELYRNGKSFEIKGAAGHTNLAKLNATGGNTIRTYDTLNLQSVLDEAAKNNLAVMVGLPLPESRYSDYVYNNPAVAKKQFHEIKRLVNRYKNHPALLIWCVGNELDFSPNPKLFNFYSEFNKIVDMIHRDDPDHPVTTTMTNFYPKNLLSLSLFTDIDILSTNLFISLEGMNTELEKVSWFWKGPFIISEWGIDGPWYSAKTAWGARIEETSQKKAARYLSMYRFMPLDNQRFLGSFVFYWGSKQETTHTWFSMFDDKGHQSEAVGVMEQNWTGKNTQPQTPDLDYMLINSKGAMENIILKPGEIANATLNITSPDSTAFTVWEIFPEDWFVIDKKWNDKKLRSVKDALLSSGYQQAKFKAPAKDGPYRLFATVYNRSGGFSTCNTPFYVVSN